MKVFSNVKSCLLIFTTSAKSIQLNAFYILVKHFTKDDTFSPFRRNECKYHQHSFVFCGVFDCGALDKDDKGKQGWVKVNIVRQGVERWERLYIYGFNVVMIPV